jgi:hypothetical protein
MQIDVCKFLRKLLHNMEFHVFAILGSSAASFPTAPEKIMMPNIFFLLVG